MKPLLLGESPAKGGDWRRPLSGRVGRTLCQLIGRHRDDHCSDCCYDVVTSRFECLNAIERETRTWSTVEAREHVHRWFIQNGTPEAIVCLGRRAAVATNLIGSSADWGRWTEWNYDGLRTDIVVIPHPSGLNRLYNDPKMRSLARRVLLEALAR